MWLNIDCDLSTRLSSEEIILYSMSDNGDYEEGKSGGFDGRQDSDRRWNDDAAPAEGANTENNEQNPSLHLTSLSFEVIYLFYLINRT
jgi:hypothetical protein